MPKKPRPKDGPHKLRPDVAETAFRTMLEATGQAPKTIPGAGPKNPLAAKWGRKGGKLGGAARAGAMSPEERQKSAQRAAKARRRRR